MQGLSFAEDQGGAVGMKGRKPKPAEIREMEGNPGRRPIPQAAKVAVMESLEAPEFLHGRARKEWQRLAPKLRDKKLLTEADRAMLALYCQAFGRWVRAEEMVTRTGGPVVETEKGNMVQNPWVSISRRSAETMAKTAVEFGLTPSSRSRTGASVQQAAGDPLEAALS